MKRWGVIMVCILWSQHAQAQDKKTIDSLHLAYTQASIDTTKIIIAIELAYIYRFSYADSTITYAQKAITESKRIGFSDWEG